MNKKQLMEFIGNIDERMVQQAEKIPNYAKQYRGKWVKRFSAVAAVISLLVCSFSVGALAFARETVVEVSVKQEVVKLEGTGLSMILPDSWRGKYLLVRNGQNYIMYHKGIREAAMTEGNGEDYDGGVLFTVVHYKEAMTPKQFVEKGYDFVEYRYLLSTKDSTYILCYASDVQWNPEEPSQEAMYTQMASKIGDICFVTEDALAD